MLFNSKTKIDRKNRVLTCESQNGAFQNIAELFEVTTFEPDSTDPNKTILTLDATLDVRICVD